MAPVASRRAFAKPVAGIARAPVAGNLCRLLFASFLLVGAAQAADQPLVAATPRGDDFEIVSHVIAGGGVSAAESDCFSLSATIGQPVVGRTSGGDFVVTAGFWAAPPPGNVIFSNGFENEVCAP